MSTSRTTVTRACSCGARLFAAVRPATLAPALAALFDAEHTGPGHERPGQAPAQLPGQLDLLDATATPGALPR